MKMGKLGNVLILGLGVWLLNGCMSQIPGISSTDSDKVQGSDFVYRGHNFGPNRDADYQRGVKDGCKTADGTYTKNHSDYRNNQSYHIGWENGRLHCTGGGNKR